MSRSVTRYHDISMAHRSVLDVGKCNNLHGHNYRFYFTFTCVGDIHPRVIDFGQIKSIFCQWLEENWDHKVLFWVEDYCYKDLLATPFETRSALDCLMVQSIAPFIWETSTENIAAWWVQIQGPELLGLHGLDHVTLAHVRVDETAKCSADAWV